jgi:PAS domain S-box-containing protein
MSRQEIGLSMSMQIFAAVGLLMLLVGAALSVTALLRLRRLRALTRRLLDDAGFAGSGEVTHQFDALDDIQRIEGAFDLISSRLKVQGTTLDQACELAGLGTWAILPDLESVRVSTHIRRVFGLPETEDVAKVEIFREQILPEDRAGFDAALKRAVEERRMADTEFRAVDVSGRIRVFRARTGPGGAVPHDSESGMSGIIQDITDLRQKETALARSQSLERLAGEAARIGGWRYNISARTFSGTPEAARLLGMTGGLDPAVEDVSDRFIDEDDRARVESNFWTCSGVGTRFDEIAKFERFDGKKIWLRIIGEANRDTSGNIVSLYGAIQDVSELVGALRATEEIRLLLQTILDALSDGFAIHDRDGKVLYMNSRANAILGIPDLDIVGKNMWEDLPDSIDPQFEKSVTEALETGESQTFEGEIATPGRWVNVAVHPTPVGVAIYLNDVTEHRDTRARLRLLDAAVSQTSDVVLVTDATMIDSPGPKVIFVNEAFENMTGFSRSEILGRSPRMLQGPDTERDRLDQIREAMKNHQPIRTEITNYRKDGSRLIVELDINPLFDAAGICTHYVSIQRETTERREAEEYLRAREEQFRLANMASRDVIWDWDMKSGVIWNSDNSDAVFADMSKWMADSVDKGRIENVLERIHPDDRLNVTESLDAALAGDATAWRCEYRILAMDDSWLQICDKAFILREDDGTPRRMVGAMSDVTDVKRLDAQLHQAQKLETVGQLTGGIAHDFNNLLTIILGNCDILLDDIGDDSELRPLLKSIDDAAERGARVSRDLLAFSRRQPLELRATDINKLIRRSFSLFGRAVDANVEIEYDLTPSATVAHVDPDKLQAALLNLVLNARSAIPRDGTITIRTRSTSIGEIDTTPDCAPGDYVQIDIVDDGTGMSTEIRERAFEPFFTTKEPGVGTGMGLSSVYGLVKQSGGHAIIDSELGQGTTISLCFPIAQEEEPATPTNPSQIAPYRGGADRILVVEDDTDLRTFVRTVLSRMGYRIVEAENGEVALAILEKDGDFDLLFTDIVMPGGVNGVQLADKAREMHPDIRIMFTSGYARDALPKERHLPSDIPMLYKPFRSHELLERIGAMLADGSV